MLTDGDTDISGTGEAGATVAVLINGAAAGTATVDADGSWDVTLDTALAAGDEVTARQTDAAGNTSALSDPVVVAEAPTGDSSSDGASESPSATPSASK